MKILFIIAVSGIALIIGRSIRDLFKKRPVRQKKARRRGLTKLFASIALLTIITLIISVSIILGIVVFYDDIDLVNFFTYVIIDAFATYIAILIIKYLKKI